MNSLGTGSFRTPEVKCRLNQNERKKFFFLNHLKLCRTQKFRKHCIYFVVNYKQAIKGQGTVSLSLTVLGVKHANFWKQYRDSYQSTRNHWYLETQGQESSLALFAVCASSLSLLLKGVSSSKGTYKYSGSAAQ